MILSRGSLKKRKPCTCSDASISIDGFVTVCVGGRMRKERKELLFLQAMFKTRFDMHTSFPFGFTYFLKRNFLNATK